MILRKKNCFDTITIHGVYGKSISPQRTLYVLRGHREQQGGNMCGSEESITEE